jgi:hypothetical protein
LKSDVLELADAHPTQVASYLQLLEVRDRVKQAFEFEKDTYQDLEAFYSFPSSRFLLYGLLAYAIKNLDELAGLLPRRKFPWHRVARTQFKAAVANLTRDWGKIEAPSASDSQAEQLVALARKKGWELSRRDSTDQRGEQSGAHPEAPEDGQNTKG